MKCLSTWSKSCVITSMERRVIPNNRRDTSPTIKITDTKLYVPVVTLSATDDNNFLEQFQLGFKKTIKWNNYRSEMTNQTKTNRLNHLIDPTFNKVHRLFVLSFENEEDKTLFQNIMYQKLK